MRKSAAVMVLVFAMMALCENVLERRGEVGGGGGVGAIGEAVEYPAVARVGLDVSRLSRPIRASMIIICLGRHS